MTFCIRVKKFVRRIKCLKLFLPCSCVLWGAQGSGEWGRAGCGLLSRNTCDLFLQWWLPALVQGTDQRCVPAWWHLEQPQQDSSLLRYQGPTSYTNAHAHRNVFIAYLRTPVTHTHAHTHTEPCYYSFTSLLFMSWLCSYCQSIKLLPIKLWAQMLWPYYKMVQNKDVDFWSVGNSFQMCYG